MRIVIAIICFLLYFSCDGQTYTDYYRFIKESEGYKLEPYKDSLGNWTVGIGHLIKKGEFIKNKYSHDEVMRFFNNDLSIAQKDVKKLFGSFDNQPSDIKLVLVSLSFNLGYNKLRGFVRFRAAIDNSDYKTAAKELKNSLWYKQVGIRGAKYYNIINNHEN